MPKLCGSWHILFKNDCAFAGHNNFQCYVFWWAEIFSLLINESVAFSMCLLRHTFVLTEVQKSE
jgi:hypothetical protein